MIYYVFSVHDSKAEAFLPPFILPKEAQALRLFSDCINSDSHQFGQNPEDYSLFRLGTFNDEDGQYLLERTQHCLGNGVSFLKSNPEIRGNGQAQFSESKLANDNSVQPSTSGENPTE